jgi:hypothetical protein
MLHTTTFRATTDFYDSAYIPRMGELVTAGSPPTRSTTNGTTVPAADSMSATKARVWQREGKAGKEGGGQGEREERKDEMKDEMKVSCQDYRTSMFPSRTEGARGSHMALRQDLDDGP